MIYYRCKCGDSRSYSSMGVPACMVCDKCRSTLGSHAQGHAPAAPHDWMTTKTEITYQGQTTVKTVTECVKCRKTLAPGVGVEPTT